MVFPNEHDNSYGVGSRDRVLTTVEQNSQSDSDGLGPRTVSPSRSTSSHSDPRTRDIPRVPSLWSNFQPEPNTSGGQEGSLYKMTRSKRASHSRHSTPVRSISRTHAYSSPTRNKFRLQRHPNLKRKHSGISYRPGNNSEDTYLSLLRSIQETENDDDAGSDGINSDASSEDGWDEENTLVEMLGCPDYNEGQILQKLTRAFADASHGLREDMILGLGPVLKIIREVRPAPGRVFITGLLRFDDACKHFEENSYRNAELSAAYAKIEADIDELFERLQAAYSRLEEKRGAFQMRVKEQTNKMRDTVSTLPADMNALLAKLEKKYTDTDNDDGRTTKTKGRERTLQGALAELQL